MGGSHCKNRMDLANGPHSIFVSYPTPLPIIKRHQRLEVQLKPGTRRKLKISGLFYILFQPAV